LAGVVGAEEDISCWVAIRIGIQRECCVDENYAEKSELHRVKRKGSILEREGKRKRWREEERKERREYFTVVDIRFKIAYFVQAHPWQRRSLNSPSGSRGRPERD
jgi:hypothetical protein